MDAFLIFLLLFVSYNPLMMVLLFFLYLCVVTACLACLLNSYFYSYVVFLLFISGLTVVLMYICSVILNEKFFINLNLNLYLIFLLSFLTWGDGGALHELSSGARTSPPIAEFYNLTKFVIYPYSLFSLFFVFYLLFCLVVVYEVIKKGKGPLRSHN